ncbi:hypothetical protein TTHERM_00193990 (macronuclear) [Tetrahymena thermophila SB210]|uniref:Uncharacterized protein n=1 Tax=Tetrahymena thermophila (strain SB210) TaxID=312017 RepID=Q23KD6_TETTS|nr:hypothetical protein TTHERM_00193990 [Tetrahymena thermophila SB210]EAR96907.2 hypothetical protein TTHERM_00193990 [Tetrahymena thermophila SB210]|eukprot:XP_001017152.2 hypothetical protein TTHERM_00193990 [Tetrahymena thermophila SB210]
MSQLRNSFHEGLAGRRNFVKSYDSIDNYYALDSEEDKSSDGYEYESSSKKIIKKKLVFSECLANSPDTPDFDNQYQFQDVLQQGKEYSSQQNSIQLQQLKFMPHSILIKSPERRNSQKKVDFCLKSKENSIHPFQKKQNEFFSSDKQLKIMKQKIKNNEQNFQHETNQLNVGNELVNMQTKPEQYQQNIQENPTDKSTNSNKQNNQELNQLNTEDNQIHSQHIETQIKQKLNLFYEQYCQKIDQIKLKLFKKDTSIKGMCSREFLKYASMHERSDQMTQQVNSVSQN